MFKKLIVLFSLLFYFSANFLFFSVNAEGKKLSVTNIEVISENKLEITFNNSLLIDKELDFYLKYKGREEDFSNTDLEGKILAIDEVKQIEVNGNKLFLLPKNPFKSNQEYEVVIISITDINGNTIESGLDGAIKFIVPEDFDKKLKEKRKKFIEKKNYRTKEMNRVLHEIREDLYKVSDIEFSTTIEVEEELRRKEVEAMRREEYEKQLAIEAEKKRIEDIKKKKLEEIRKKVFEARQKKLEEIRRKKLEEERRRLEKEKKELEEKNRLLREEEERLRMGLINDGFTSAGADELLKGENLAGRSIEVVNLEGEELAANQKAEDLPITGPKEYFMFFLSLILVGIFYHFNKSKKA